MAIRETNESTFFPAIGALAATLGAGLIGMFVLVQIIDTGDGMANRASGGNAGADAPIADGSDPSSVGAEGTPGNGGAEAASPFRNQPAGYPYTTIFSPAESAASRASDEPYEEESNGAGNAGNAYPPYSPYAN